MRRMMPFLLGLAALGLLTADAPARSIAPDTYTMEVLVDGRPLTKFPARGTTYIEALNNREYSVRLANHTGRRVAVALSVDGLNSIDAKRTSAIGASKWILGPYETITIDGWQTGNDTARRFFFTTEDKSYGAWLGKTDDLGIVSAAFFREKLPKPRPYVKRMRESGEAQRAPAGAKARAEADAPTLSDDHAATGIGRELDHRVRRVRFDAESRPASVIQLRYEYRDALISLGVLPPYGDPISRRERARGFEDTGFAPDPYRVRR